VGFEITAPFLKSCFEGNLSLESTAREVAPFFLMWSGFGMDPSADAGSEWIDRRERLFRRIVALGQPARKLVPVLNIAIRPVSPSDSSIWESMRHELWPADAGDHGKEIAAFFRGALPSIFQVLIATGADGEPVGFAELSIRSIADGCLTMNVGYVEGWYVRPAARRQGVGAALIHAAEDWARAQGCLELASDAECSNELGVAAHRALGFEEQSRVVCFRKALSRSLSEDDPR